MYYTINLSPLLVIKKGFILIIILSSYQQCPLPLNSLTLSRKQKCLIRIPGSSFLFIVPLFCLLHRGDEKREMNTPRRLASITTPKPTSRIEIEKGVKNLESLKDRNRGENKFYQNLCLYNLSETTSCHVYLASFSKRAHGGELFNVLNNLQG